MFENSETNKNANNDYHRHILPKIKYKNKFEQPIYYSFTLDLRHEFLKNIINNYDIENGCFFLSDSNWICIFIISIKLNGVCLIQSIIDRSIDSILKDLPNSIQEKILNTVYGELANTIQDIDINELYHIMFKSLHLSQFTNNCVKISYLDNSRYFIYKIFVAISNPTNEEHMNPKTFSNTLSLIFINKIERKKKTEKVSLSKSLPSSKVSRINYLSLMFYENFIVTKPYPINVLIRLLFPKLMILFNNINLNSLLKVISVSTIPNYYGRWRCHEIHETTSKSEEENNLTINDQNIDSGCILKSSDACVEISNVQKNGDSVGNIEYKMDQIRKQYRNPNSTLYEDIDTAIVTIRQNPVTETLTENIKDNISTGFNVASDVTPSIVYMPSSMNQAQSTYTNLQEIGQVYHKHQNLIFLVKEEKMTTLPNFEKLIIRTNKVNRNKIKHSNISEIDFTQYYLPITVRNRHIKYSKSIVHNIQKQMAEVQLEINNFMIPKSEVTTYKIGILKFNKKSRKSSVQFSAFGMHNNLKLKTPKFIFKNVNGNLPLENLNHPHKKSKVIKVRYKVLSLKNIRALLRKQK